MATDSELHDVVDELAVAPSALQQEGAQQDAPRDLLQDHKFPTADFAKARINKKNSRVPQVIAHRGFKSKYPENSLLAFREAIKAGASAIETDTQLTKDGIVVLSHDGDLKRFGDAKRKILDCTWAEIEPMETLVEPRQRMLRLSDLLEFLLETSLRESWLLLDVKTTCDAEDVMRLIASTITSARPLPGKPWNKRILLGLWTTRQHAFAARYLPDFPVVHNGFHLPHARRHLQDGDIGTNTIVQSLLGPGGGRFLRECQRRAGPDIAWTVNDRYKAEWCARRELDGLITDDPQAMAQILDHFDGKVREPWIPVPLADCFHIAFIYILVNGFFWYFRGVLKLDDDGSGRKGGDKEDEQT